MPLHVSPCRICAVGGGAALVVSNTLAWATSIDVGALATSITILGGAICGVVALVITTVVTTLGKARAEAWATQERIRIQVRVEEERLQADSLTGQLERVRASLHELRNQSNVAALAHHEELERLTRQLESTTRTLEETTEELHATRDELRKARGENARVVALLATRQVEQDRRIADNTQAIQEVASRSSDEVPTVAHDPPGDRG